MDNFSVWLTKRSTQRHASPVLRDIIGTVQEFAYHFDRYAALWAREWHAEQQAILAGEVEKPIYTKPSFWRYLEHVRNRQNTSEELRAFVAEFDGDRRVWRGASTWHGVYNNLKGMGLLPRGLETARRAFRRYAEATGAAEPSRRRVTHDRMQKRLERFARAREGLSGAGAAARAPAGEKTPTPFDPPA